MGDHGEKLSLEIAEALAELPPEKRLPFLRQVIKGTQEIMGFYDEPLEETNQGGYGLFHGDEVVPEKIGRYQVKRLLGEGTMGRVFEAWDPFSEHKVAIKTMNSLYVSGLENRQKFQKRFMREARIYGKLDHPNIVKLIDYFEDLKPYIVLEFVQGQPLSAVMESRPQLEKTFIFNLVRQISGALDYAHHRDIVHRDLKPANILIAQNGVCKLADFGISKVIDGGTIATTGFLGTPKYASPEQIKGRKVDHRTDLYALAILVHQMVTGTHPFQGQNLEQTLINISSNPPFVRSTLPYLGLSDVRFREFIQTALAKSPADRFSHMGEFVAAFNALDPQSDPQGWIVPPPCRRKPIPLVSPNPFAPWKIWIWVLLFLSLSAAAIYGWMRQSRTTLPETTVTKPHFMSAPGESVSEPPRREDNFRMQDGLRQDQNGFPPGSTTPSYIVEDPSKAEVRDPFAKPKTSFKDRNENQAPNE